MNALTQSPPANFLRRLESRVQSTFPTLFQWLVILCWPLRSMRRVIRTYPSLSMLALALFTTVGIFKYMTFREIVSETAIAGWVESNGGSCQSYDFSGHTILLFIAGAIDGGSVQDGPITAVHIPTAVINTQPDYVFALLSQLPKLDVLTISFGAERNEQDSPATAEITSEISADDGRLLNTINSDKLQRGLASLPRGISLVINECSLTHCDHPIDLTYRLKGLSLDKVHITRDFAGGLPIIKHRGVMILDSRIDDDAVEILLERLQSDELQLYRCGMSERTKLRLSGIKGALLHEPEITETAAAANADPPRNVESNAAP